MKKLFYLLIVVFVTSLASCSAGRTLKSDTEVAGYNLKCKKEQMQNKILHSGKTLLATP